jgi:hypothetical protein
VVSLRRFRLRALVAHAGLLGAQRSSPAAPAPRDMRQWRGGEGVAMQAAWWQPIRCVRRFQWFVMLPR